MKPILNRNTMGLFLISAKQIENNRVLLNETESHHLIKVLRKKNGDTLQLSDGEGNYYEGRLILEANGIAVQILKTLAEAKASDSPLVLCPALLKNPRMDWLMEKACELQADAVFPYLSERTVVKAPSGREREQKIERWRKLAAAALKQSKQSRLPQIGPIFSFTHLLERFKNTKAVKLLFLAETPEIANLKTLEKEKFSKSEAPLWIALIGPEGGLTAKEIAEAKNAGFTPCSLGGVTLRAETAALASLAILRYLRSP